LFASAMALIITGNPPASYVGNPPAIIVLVAVLFSLFHLSMLPVIAALDAPSWAKGSGYGWVVADNMIVFMSYFGVGAELTTPMRWGVHLATATWISAASWRARGAMRWVGAAAGAAFLGASYAG